MVLPGGLMNQFDYEMMFRLLSHNVLSYKQLFQRMQAHNLSIGESFHDDFICFSELYLTPYKAPNRHLLYKPIYYFGRKFFLRKILFKFNGFNDFVYFLSSPDLNLFHEFLSEKLSLFLDFRGFHYDYNKTYAGARISYDFILSNNIALEVETGLKANNFSDLERRLGIFPLHSENINKRFLDSPFIYILVPNLSVLEHYFKHFMHLNDKFGFSVFSAFKFDLLTFDQFSRLSLFV